MRITPYQSSGGESEARTYDGGEEVLIEVHEKGNFAVAWSSLKPLGELLELVRPEIQRHRLGKIRMGKLEGEPVDLRKRKAFDAVAADPEGWNCANFYLGKEHVTWHMPSPEAPHLGEVGIAASNPRSELLRKLLFQTAMPQIVEDAPGIFESIEHL